MEKDQTDCGRAEGRRCVNVFVSGFGLAAPKSPTLHCSRSVGVFVVVGLHDAIRGRVYCNHGVSPVPINFHISVAGSQ